MNGFYRRFGNYPTLDRLLSRIEKERDFNSFLDMLDRMAADGLVNAADEQEYYEEAYFKCYGEYPESYEDYITIESSCDINCDDDIEDNTYMETYYNIMNILDAHAVRFEQLSPETIAELDRLAEGLGPEPIKYHIESIADANDCGGCSTWQEVVDCLSDSFANGDRI